MRQTDRGQHLCDGWGIIKRTWGGGEWSSMDVEVTTDETGFWETTGRTLFPSFHCSTWTEVVSGSSPCLLVCQQTPPSPRPGRPGWRLAAWPCRSSESCRWSSAMPAPTMSSTRQEAEGNSCNGRNRFYSGGNNWITETWFESLSCLTTLKYV